MWNNPATYWGSNNIPPPSLTNLIGWYEADYGVTKSYGNAPGNITGTTGTNSLVSNTDLSAWIFPSMSIKANNADIYTVSAISTVAGISTITTSTNLIDSYSANNLKTEYIRNLLDNSGNSNDAAEAVGFANFLYLPAASNGKAALVSPTGSTAMALPSALYSLPNGDNTVFVVSKTNEADKDGGLFSVVNTGTAVGTAMYYVQAGTTGSIYYQNGNIPTVINNITQTTFNILRGRRNGTTQAISINNATEVTNTNAINESSANLAHIGDSQLIVTVIGQIQALLIYNASLDTTNRNLTNTYLQNKFGTP